MIIVPIKFSFYLENGKETKIESNDENMNITEFQYPDGWYMRVGQVYSSPYESYHTRITRIDRLNNEEQVIYFEKLNPRDYTELWSDEEERAYAWWFNEGHWDLEVDVYV